jgi:hypothetical protein
MNYLTYPVLCFNELGSNYVQLALDYWAGISVEGRWKWESSLEALSQLHGVPKKDIPKLVNSAATAFSQGRRCAHCNFPQEISSRSTFVARSYGEHFCASCRHVMSEARQRKLDEEERQFYAAQRSVIAEVSQRQEVCRYENVSYFDAILIFSILLASDEACDFGTFQQTENLHLCAGRATSSELLSRLFRAGILSFHESTPPQAIVMGEKSGWSYLPHRVNWQFSPD